jgi:hypothetical protein
MGVVITSRSNTSLAVEWAYSPGATRFELELAYLPRDYDPCLPPGVWL